MRQNDFLAAKEEELRGGEEGTCSIFQVYFDVLYSTFLLIINTNHDIIPPAIYDVFHELNDGLFTCNSCISS